MASNLIAGLAERCEDLKKTTCKDDVERLLKLIGAHPHTRYHWLHDDYHSQLGRSH